MFKTYSCIIFFSECNFNCYAIRNEGEWNKVNIIKIGPTFLIYFCQTLSYERYLIVVPALRFITFSYELKKKLILVLKFVIKFRYKIEL